MKKTNTNLEIAVSVNKYFGNIVQNLRLNRNQIPICKRSPKDTALASTANFSEYPSNKII